MDVETGKLANEPPGGYSDAEIIGRNFEILHPLKLREHARRLHKQAMGGEIVKGFPTVSVRGDGSEIAVMTTLIPVRGIDGTVTCVACIATPIPWAVAIAQANPRPRKSAVFVDDLTANIPSHR